MRKILITITMALALMLNGPLFAAPININEASAQQLADNLEGIGLKKAQAIVEYRQKIGSFSSQAQLLNVKGIGKATLEKNQANILIE